MVKRNLEQGCTIKCCVKRKENATETYKKLKRAFGERSVWSARIFRWHKEFLDGRDSVEDEPRSGRICTSKTDENVTKVRALLMSYRRLTVRMIGSDLNFNHQTVHDILAEELGMRKICAKLAPKISPTNKRKPDGMCAWAFLNASKMTKMLSNMS